MAYKPIIYTPPVRPPKVWCPWCDGNDRTLSALKAHNIRCAEDGERTYKWTK